MSKKKITKAELSKVKYGELLAKFTELGVPEVWKAGSKKMTMIEKAIEQVSLKSSLEDAGLNADQIEKKVEEVAVAKIEKKQKEEVAKIEKQEADDAQAKSKIDNAGLTLEQIEYNIKNINANIKFGVAGQRVALLKKLEWLEDLKKNM